MLTFPSIVKVTVTGLRISAVDTVAFLDNCADLIPYAGSGRRIRIKDAAGKYLDGVLGARGTGESLGGELLTGWNFTSGWNNSAAGSIYDNNTYKSVGGSGGVYKNGVLEAGKLYKAKIEASDNSDKVLQAYSGSAIQAIADFGSYGYRTGDSYNKFYLRNTLYSVTTDVTSIELKQVLTPSTSGLLIRNLAGAQSFQSQESGFTHNAASYVVEVFDMMRVARPIRYMGSSVHHI